MNILAFIDKYNGSLAFLISLVVAISALVHYISVRRAEERGRQYDRYHKLLQDLNVDVDGTAPYIDRQIAVIYELRNFPEYWPVSIRILERSIPRWNRLTQDKKQGIPMLGEKETGSISQEALLTISFIKRRQLEKSYLCIAKEDRD